VFFFLQSDYIYTFKLYGYKGKKKEKNTRKQG